MIEPPVISPDDEHNRRLAANVRPPGYRNPEPASRYDLAVLGAGTAGLVAAAGAAGLGARVALVERRWLGGDCLNVGCVPSKTLVRAASRLAEAREAPAFGVAAREAPRADFAAVMERMRRLRADISAHDSVERFRGLGVDVFLGEGRFEAADVLAVDGRTLRFKRALVATGARPAAPPISGLPETGYLTNETVFSLTERPRRLAIIGAGSVGCELAQALGRLGSEITLFDVLPQILAREDGDAAEIVRQALERDGVRLALPSEIHRVACTPDGKTLHVSVASRDEQVTVDDILVGTGRVPNVEGIGLERAGVDFDRKRGVHVDDHLRTTNPRVFAAGDVCLDVNFTHAADFAARIVLRNAFFFGRSRFSALTIPACTYTDPEVARVGLNERGAAARGIPVEPFLRRLGEVDRALIDGEPQGFVKVLVRKGSDRIVGATIVARQAGDLIGEIALAMATRTGLGRLADVVHPYPTRAEAIRQLGDAYNRTRLTPWVRRILATWLRWMR